MKYTTLTLVVCALFFGSSVEAETFPDSIQAFRQVSTIQSPSIVVPTVLEFPIEAGAYERKSYAVYDVTRSQFLPHIVFDTYETMPVVLTAKSGSPYDANLTDGSEDTSVDYYVSEGLMNSARVVITSAVPVTSSSLTLDLDQYVALPSTIKIVARERGEEERIVLSETALRDSHVFFPKVTADEWVVTLTYIQPLRINEIRLSQDDVVSTMKRNVRFLAQPGGVYSFYRDADRYVSIQTPESGNLYNNEDVRGTVALSPTANPAYKEADIDTDGIPDTRDNCVQEVNADQKDIDRNGRGDACDDFDKDGVVQTKDNCPDAPNWNQEDEDGDGIGDTCDGEESRITEKYGWIPWAGMGIATIVLIVLFALMATAPKKETGSV
jgi:hypothetical protein